MKSIYNAPAMDIHLFAVEDVVRTSGGEYATNGIYSNDGEWSGFNVGA